MSPEQQRNVEILANQALAITDAVIAELATGVKLWLPRSAMLEMLRSRIVDIREACRP